MQNNIKRKSSVKDVEILITHQAPAGVMPMDTPGKRSQWEEGTKDFVDLFKKNE